MTTFDHPEESARLRASRFYGPANDAMALGQRFQGMRDDAFTPEQMGRVLAFQARLDTPDLMEMLEHVIPEDVCQDRIDALANAVRERAAAVASPAERKAIWQHGRSMARRIRDEHQKHRAHAEALRSRDEEPS